MTREIKLAATHTFVTIVNDKYFVDTRIDFKFEGGHGKTSGCAFLKWMDDSNEYGDGENQQLTIKASEFDNAEKKVVKQMIYDFYNSLNTDEIIKKHLEMNLAYFTRKLKLCK